MKRFYLLSAVLSFSISAAFAQTKNKHIEIGVGYNAAIPQGSMQNHINTIHGADVQALYLIPHHNRWGVGLEMMGGSYAAVTRHQVFGFNGTSTPTDVKYYSNVNSGGVVVRYNIIQKQNYSAFTALRGGVTNYKSNLEVEDPKDQDGCHPLETKDLIEDHTWQAGARVGASLDMHAIARKFPGNLFYLQGYAGYVMGGNVDYINVKNTTMDNGHMHNATNADGTPIEMQFINVATQETHEHEVARVYNSPVRFLEAGISLVIKF